MGCGREGSSGCLASPPVLPLQGLSIHFCSTKVGAGLRNTPMVGGWLQRGERAWDEAAQLYYLGQVTSFPGT